MSSREMTFPKVDGTRPLNTPSVPRPEGWRPGMPIPQAIDPQAPRTGRFVTGDSTRGDETVAPTLTDE